MKRGRGQPRKDSADAELVTAVRAAEARGLTVMKACEEIAGEWSGAERVRRHYAADQDACAEQLERRYHRVATEYFELTDPRRVLVSKLAGLPLLVRRRVSAYKLFKARAHKK